MVILSRCVYNPGFVIQNVFSNTEENLVQVVKVGEMSCMMEVSYVSAKFLLEVCHFFCLLT